MTIVSDDTMTGPVAEYPALSERSEGWLRYLHRKATTPDDWSRQGQPHPHWDDRSDPPMVSWHRFDLLESTYAVGLMANTTPAWREVYSRILDELAARHTSYWAARDWLEQIGHDPERERYPEHYRLWIPQDRWGCYDIPGWTANGIEPHGLQMDPIGADGNLFFKGFFLVVLGLHRLVSEPVKESSWRAGSGLADGSRARWGPDPQGPRDRSRGRRAYARAVESPPASRGSRSRDRGAALGAHVTPPAAIQRNAL